MRMILPCLRHAFLGATRGNDTVAKDSHTAREACEQLVPLSYGTTVCIIESRQEQSPTLFVHRNTTDCVSTKEKREEEKEIHDTHTEQQFEICRITAEGRSCNGRTDDDFRPGRWTGAPGGLMPNIGTTLDRLLGQTQGLGIATLPSVSSSILVPTLIFPYPCRFSGGLLSMPFPARTLSDAAPDTACLA